MAKKKAVQQRPRKQRKAQQRDQFGQSLGDAARKYAALLADPCNGPLVQSPFGAGSGGLVSRFETDYVIGDAPSTTAVALCFAPAIPQVWTPAANLTADNLPVTWALNNGSPGRPYLLANSRAFRCLSACVQVYWAGSELSRGGVISLGQMSVQEAGSATVTVAQLRAASQYVERMPEKCAELVWRPTEAELAWNKPIDNSDSDRYSALYVTAGGLPATSGVRIRIVAVYEWLPSADLSGGMVLPTTKPGSRDTLGGVLETLDRFGNWMYHGAGSVAKTVSSLVAGGTAVGRVAGGTYRMGRMLMG